MLNEQSTRATVLVVEDNPDLNIAICETLRAFDYNVYSAPNGLEALERLKEKLPDVILCDIMMPGMDGYTLLQRTRSDTRWNTLPFIFLTARTSTEDQRKAKEIGIEDYLTKPVDSEDLVASINNALRRRQLMEEEMQRQMDMLRSHIVGILQHEFRTPLTFVLGYAEYLLDSTRGPIDMNDLRSSASAILEGGRRLERLIEGFLMLAALQNRRINPEELKPLNSLMLWLNVMQVLKPELDAAGLVIHIEDRNTTEVVNGDLDLLNEALRRLLDNTIRYRRPDSQNVWLSIERLSTYVGLRIRDEGAGIPPEELEQLSRPFEQVDRDNRTQPGAGISLSMIHHIARLHQGSFELESEVGVGSTFTIWLPATNTPSDPTLHNE